MVGPQGHVIGVDMTAEQLDVAKGTLDWHMDKFFGSKDTSNVTFHQVNLSSNKTENPSSPQCIFGPIFVRLG
jgi:tRNA A58 N-methylase Trm61